MPRDFDRFAERRLGLVPPPEGPRQLEVPAAVVMALDGLEDEVAEALLAITDERRKFSERPAIIKAIILRP